MVSTDNGKTWESVKNGEVTRSPGRTLLFKGLLQIAATTVLDSYTLEINPMQYMLFTGKELDEDIGLVYFGARWYDPESGRFITVDPVEDGENWYALCGNDPINNIDPDGRMVWFIHGTNTTHETWLRDYPDFTCRVAQYFYDRYDTSFEWGKDNNSNKARISAAKDLATKIRAWHMKHPSKPIRLVGHSHGGNVAILAANLLGDPREGTPIPIDNLITVSTPVTKYFRQYSNVNVHNHVYNIQDSVQVNGGSNKSTANVPNWIKNFRIFSWRPLYDFTMSQIPKANKSGAPGEFGIAQRPFPGANNIPINISDHVGPTRSLDAHSDVMENIDAWIYYVEPKLRWI